MKLFVKSLQNTEKTEGFVKKFHSVFSFRYGLHFGQKTGQTFDLFCCFRYFPGEMP